MNALLQLKSVNEQRIQELTNTGDFIQLKRELEFRDYINYQIYQLNGQLARPVQITGHLPKPEDTGETITPWAQFQPKEKSVTYDTFDVPLQFENTGNIPSSLNGN